MAGAAMKHLLIFIAAFASIVAKHIRSVGVGRVGSTLITQTNPNVIFDIIRTRINERLIGFYDTVRVGYKCLASSPRYIPSTSSVTKPTPTFINVLLTSVLGLTILSPIFIPVVAQDLQSVSTEQDLGAKLPLVTAGSSLRWLPLGDEAEFSLPQAAYVRLSIYSPSIDENEIGDEVYDPGLTSRFTFAKNREAIKSESYQLAPSEWVVFYEGSLAAARYVLRSEVTGRGKNVYLLKLETSLPNIPLQGYSTTINVSSYEWADAFTFDIKRNTFCQLEMYDGDGPTELEAFLVQPLDVKQAVTISEDLQKTIQPLPRLQGRYTVRLRLPSTAQQITNSVRFTVVCSSIPQLVTLVPPSDTIVAHPIAVSVVDTLGNTLEIPYTVTGEFDREVTLTDADDYTLVNVMSEGGMQTSERSVRFGVQGGQVTYVLEKLPQPLPLPEPEVELVTPAETPPTEPTPAETPPTEPGTVTSSALLLERSMSQEELLACQTVSVSLFVRNTGDAATSYILREVLPAGLLPVNTGNAMINGNELSWTGDIAAGESLQFDYIAEVTPELAPQSQLMTTLNDVVVSEATLYRYETVATLERVSPEGVLYAGDEVAYRLTVDNPLSRDVALTLTPTVANLELTESPSSINITAKGNAEATFRGRVQNLGVIVLQVNPFACESASLETHASGLPAEAREQVAAMPELPQPYQSSTVTVDMAAYQLPVIDGLVLVQGLPEGVQYVAGSTLIDGERASDPLQAQTQPDPNAEQLLTVNADGSVTTAGPGTSLVFELPEKSIATLSFTVVHNVPYKASSADSTLIVLTPEPEVLIGSEDALRYYQEAVPIDVAVAVRERVGAVILSPAPGTVIRSGSSTGVTVDTPIDEVVKLFVNDEAIGEDRIGTKTLDGSAGRQTFDYIGLTLKEGRNVIRLESTDAAGQTRRDEIEVFLAGVPEIIEITPLSELIADSADPLEFALRIEDAWGNAPIDSFVTLEIDGASPADADADTQQAGYQVAFTNGTAVLRLEPVTEPKTVTLTAVIGRELGKRTFAITSNLRDWIVDGYASVGANVGPGGFKFGLGGSAFARGRIFNDYLLTLAANYPLDPLGYFGSDPLGRAYITFPVTGSDNPLNQDAYSLQGVYARLERDENYIQYGDFVTLLDGSLLSLTRPYTGLSFDYNAGKEGFGVRGYGAYTKPSDRVSDLYIKSDGTREYQLPDRDVKLDTLQLEVIKGDCTTPRDFVEDNDPLLRALRQGIDYVADKSGILRLAFRLPLTDANGECYYLKANYQLEPTAEAARRWQFGVQGTYKTGVATFRAGAYQENLLGTYARVIAAGVKLETAQLTGDAELAYGTTPESGGLAATLRLGYRQDALSAEVSYRYFATGYRSAVITDATAAGHELRLAASYALTTNLILSADAQWRQYAVENETQLETSALATYTAPGDVQVGEALLARDPAFQLGVQYVIERNGNKGLRGVAGVTLKDIFGLERTEVSIIHRQGFDTTSSTDFSVAYQILENLALRVTDRVVWGNSTNIIFGVEAGFENDAILGTVCGAVGCLVDPTIPLGTTTVTAQYELAGGIAGDVGRAQLGVDTQVPLTDKLTVTAGASQSLDFKDGSKNETVLSAGASFNEPDVIQAQISNDLRFGVTVKNVYFAGATFTLADNVYGNTTIDYLYDGSSTPRHGFKFAVAFAYRGDRLSILSNQTARLGQYASEKTSELTGDTRVNYQLDETWSFRTGYLYDSNPDLGWRDMTSFGVTGNLWRGGSATVYGRLFHDWQDKSWNFGVTLEASQEIACGVYGVAGYNAFNGVGENYGGYFGDPGLFVRFDIVFDEQWRCGAGSISGYVFHDDDQDSTRDEGEGGISGVTVNLMNANGEIVKIVYSDANGVYYFGNISPGRYSTVADVPYGYELTMLPEMISLGFSQTIQQEDIGLFSVKRKK
jgi:SdrD B-like domain